MYRTILRTPKRKVRRDTLLEFYRVMAVPTLLYDGEVWSLTKRNCNDIQAVEIKFLRLMAGYTLRDGKRNYDKYLAGMSIFSINEQIIEYRDKWKEHLNRH